MTDRYETSGAGRGPLVRLIEEIGKGRRGGLESDGPHGCAAYSRLGRSGAHNNGKPLMGYRCGANSVGPSVLGRASDP